MMKIFWILFLGLFYSFSAEAKISYNITVPVDIEAQDSVAAKDMAMTEAQRKAFLEAAAKLTSQENVEKLNTLEDSSILHFIKAVTVADEKAGGTKYKANLTVQINEQLLKDYLSENDMIKLEPENLLIIPVFLRYAQGYPLLWEEDNLWLKSWRAKGLIKFGALQMRTINDQYLYVDDLNAQNALYMPEEVYRQVSQINGSDKVYVLYAQTLENGDLKITVKNMQNKNEEDFSVLNDGGDIFDKAIEKSVMFVANMERASKVKEVEHTENVIEAVYMYQDMKDWLLKSKVLTELEPVEAVETKSFGGGKVNFAVKYTGSLDNLWDILQENGFSHEAANGYYIIR